MLLCPPPLISSAAAVDYATALAAVTDVTTRVRADTSIASNGDTLSTVSWADNNGGNPYNTSAFNWNTNSQNGLRGVNSQSSTQLLTKSAGWSLGNMFNSQFGRDVTVFVVAKMNGTQGTGTGDNRYTNTVLIGAQDSWAIVFEASSRQFTLYMYGTGYQFSASTFSYTDNTAFALALSVSSAGNLRWNFNGDVVTQNVGFSATGSQAETAGFMCRSGTASNTGQIIYEAVVSHAAQTATVMDNLISGLKTKWGIA